MSPVSLLLAALAALGAGLINALAGGGTLLSFPVLTAVGVPALPANITNAVALCPGYFGATLAQRHDLRGQRDRLLVLLPASAIGGLAGGLLLLHSGERVFRSAVPFLILLASVLLALQDPLRRWLSARVGRAAPASALRAAVPIGVASIYGGYFGAGLSVIVLAVLGITLDDSLTRLNALKQAIALSGNVAAALLFLFSGRVVWQAALVMAVGALVGGAMGMTMGTLVPPNRIQIMFALILTPLLFTGAVQYPWPSLGHLRWFQIIALFNPMTYVSEGLRAALVPDVPHIAPWVCLLVLPTALLVLLAIGARGFVNRSID